MGKPDSTLHETASDIAPRWKRSQSITLVHHLNEHCLERIAELATAQVAVDLPLIVDNRELWTRLNPEARSRAARFPFVMLDLHFADEAWWHREVDKPSPSVAQSAVVDGLPLETCERLAQETLMFAWQMARSDRTAAQVSFAMRPTVAALIENLIPCQVRDLATRRSGDIRVRWANEGRFWRELLLAADRGADDVVTELHLRAKLLLLGPLIYARP